jgi:hypothetical protein
MELIKSISIENLVSQRQAVAERIVDAVKLLCEASKISEAANLGEISDLFRDRYSYEKLFSVNGPAKILKEIDGKAWKFLMQESGMQTFMSASTRQKWYEEIEKGEYPELSIENIAATFANLHRSRHDMLEEGLIECFRKLSWDYKSNSPRKFGKKIILDRLFSSYGSLEHRPCDQLDDLLRVFYIFESKPEPEYNQRVYCRIWESKRQSDSWENEYVHIRWYKKGSGHVKFKRLDLVKRCNEILAKHHPNALPPET